MSRHGAQNRSPADGFCSMSASTMYPKFRGFGIWSIASSARAGGHLMWPPCEQDCPSRRPNTKALGTAGQSMPRPSGRQDRTGAYMAGKPQTLATTSAFEILGPIMVGPSSSHTAGALRCAPSCRQPAGRPHHQDHLWPVELLRPHLPRPRHRPCARRGHPGPRHR